MQERNGFVRASGAGAAYFCLVFAIAFVFGVLRVILVAPLIGEIAAVSIEAPLLVVISWLMCAWSTRRFSVEPRFPLRAWMGGLAFTLLMLVEFGMAVPGLGRPPGDYFVGLASTAGAIGLIAQIVFAAVPIFQSHMAPSWMPTPDPPPGSHPSP